MRRSKKHLRRAPKEANEKAPASEKVAADPAPTVGSTEPIKPNPVKTFSVQPGAMHAAALSPLPSPSRKLMPTPASATAAAITTVATVKSEPKMPAMPSPPPTTEAKPKPTEIASAGAAVPAAAADAAREANIKRGDWVIQVGAFDTEIEAKERLTLAQSKIKDVLGQANSFTEKLAKGDKTMYRARFAGLDRNQAEQACKNLKRSDIPCMLLKSN